MSLRNAPLLPCKLHCPNEKPTNKDRESKRKDTAARMGKDGHRAEPPQGPACPFPLTSLPSPSPPHPHPLPHTSVFWSSDEFFFFFTQSNQYVEQCPLHPMVWIQLLLTLKGVTWPGIYGTKNPPVSKTEIPGSSLHSFWFNILDIHF